MATALDKRTRHFQIGIVPMSLTTSVRGLLDEYTSLYAHFLRPTAHEKAIHVEVHAKRMWPWHRRRYDVTVNGRLQFEPTRAEGFLPYIEWAANWEIATVLPEHLYLHAASMELEGMGVIFAGVSGSGKSTLTAGLLAHGWGYLCDEFAMVHTRTLALHPYPRAICIKESGFGVIKSLGLKLHGNRRHIKGSKGPVGFVNPLAVRSDAIGRICPIRCVIFPKYTRGARPAIVQISRAEAAFELHKVCFNLVGCEGLATEVFATVVRSAKCYKLVSGEINATCELIQDLVRNNEQRRALSA